MTVAVTGATGFVGRYTVRALADRGVRVRALVRDREKARRTLGPAMDEGRVDLIVGEVFNRSATAELCRGCSGVVHTIGIRKEGDGGSTYARMHQLATQIMLESAISAGAARFVHVSALGVRANAPTAYHRSKYEAELLVRRSGIAWTILRPSLIHGPDGELMQMIKAWVLGRAQPWFFIPYFTRVEKPAGFGPPRLVSALVQPVAVEDVAAAAAESLARPDAAGEVFTLVGPERLDWPTMLAAVRDALPLGDPSTRIRGVPGPLAAILARVAGALGLGNAIPFGPSEPVMATEDSTGSPDKAGAFLGLIPRPFTPTMRAYAARI
ncbi:MAG: NAD(P)H-binding protein [Phycisphaerales bacterium]|nr:NAD(P)H-binding protein [Phycisphaerales bacterium]